MNDVIDMFLFTVLTGKVLTLFSVNFWSTQQCWPTVSNVLVTFWLTVDGQVTVGWKWGLLFTITQWLDQCWITFVMVRAKFLLTLQGL